MAVMRDVVAHFSVFVDDAPLSKLDRKIDRLTKDIIAFQYIVAPALRAVAGGFFHVVEAASNAEEQLNVLQATFKENSDAVIQWSRTTGREVRRSQYTLQSIVSEFGAYLEPKFDTQQVTDYSQALAKLTVDLSSFYNVSEEVAKTRLFSGLTGETEAVRRFGVDISEETLRAQYEKDVGADQAKRYKYQSLDQRQKTMYRLRQIFADTAKVQGDAARTAESYANQVRNLTDAWKDLSTEIGKRFMNAAKGLIKRTNDITRLFRFAVLRTEALTAAFVTLGAAATAWAVNASIAWLSVLGNIPKLIAAVKGLTLAFGKLALVTAGLVLSFYAIEDFLGFLEGKRSLIGEFLTEMTGFEDPLARLNVGWRELTGHIFNAVEMAKELARWTAMIVTFGASGRVDGKGFKWDPAQTYDATQQRNYEQQLAAGAAMRGDKTAFTKIARERLGMGAKEADVAFLNQRRKALESPGVVPNTRDVGSGLISEDEYQRRVNSPLSNAALGYASPRPANLPTTAPLANSPMAGTTVQNNFTIYAADAKDTADQIRKRLPAAQVESERQAERERARRQTKAGLNLPRSSAQFPPQTAGNLRRQ